LSVQSRQYPLDPRDINVRSMEFTIPSSRCDVSDTIDSASFRTAPEPTPADSMRTMTLNQQTEPEDPRVAPSWEAVPKPSPSP